VFEPRSSPTPSAAKRQQEALAMLRGFNAAQAAAGRGARGASTPTCCASPIPRRAPGATSSRPCCGEGCRNLAALHNGTSAGQREQAARRLQAYQSDLRQLVAAR
jgi:hypothetical protein